MHPCKVAPILHYVSRRNESALNCPRVELFQPSCDDFGCHDCLSDFINVDGFHDDAILGVVAQNLLIQLPNTAEPYTLVRDYGHVTYEQLDKARIGTDRGMYNFEILLNFFRLQL